MPADLRGDVEQARAWKVPAQHISRGTRAIRLCLVVGDQRLQYHLFMCRVKRPAVASRVQPHVSRFSARYGSTYAGVVSAAALLPSTEWRSRLLISA